MSDIFHGMCYECNTFTDVIEEEVSGSPLCEDCYNEIILQPFEISYY